MPATLRAVASAVGQGTSISCTKPTGTAEGDLMLAFQSADRGTLAQMTTPSGGWNLLGSQQWADAEPGTKVFWKIAGASEPTSYGFAQNSTADGVVAIASVIVSVVKTPVFASSASVTSTTSVPTPSITPTAADDLEFRWATSQGVGSALSWTPPATYTQQVNRQSATYTTASLATKTLTSAAATGIQNFTSSVTTANHMGFTVAVVGTPFQSPKPLVFGQALQRAAFY
ncbi:hypothetical protein ABZ897_00930 [Nonomuraea sp. NPDC046802]|uniref:hypothetical protein n=1 Tax=Nonomuraea sp. NPDC046802 TaxID=3154919 RepID=UPI0033D8F1AA